LKAEWEEGKHLIVLSNQGDSRPKIREEWKAKLPLITSKVCISQLMSEGKEHSADDQIPAGVPIRIIAALSKTDVYRKPNSGMFDIVRELYRSKGYEIDMEHSVYVGDAAGRLAIGGRRKDHGDTDYKLALNVGLKFVTPEVSPIRSDRQCKLLIGRNIFSGCRAQSFPNRPWDFTRQRST
jgi:bifunctional polynucleotide phosphatase/kinase